MAVAKHILLDLFECDQEILNSPDIIRDVIDHSVALLQATRIGEIQKVFIPQGFTYIVGLEESHMSIHTWPEENFAAIDIFTCSDYPPDSAIELLVSMFIPEKYTLNEVARGAK